MWEEKAQANESLRIQTSKWQFLNLHIYISVIGFEISYHWTEQGFQEKKYQMDCFTPTYIMGEKISIPVTTLENHSNQKAQGNFTAMKRRVWWGQSTSKGKREMRQQRGREANQPQLQTEIAPRVWCHRIWEQAGVLSYSGSTTCRPLFLHLQYGDDNGNYPREALLV